LDGVSWAFAKQPRLNSVFENTFCLDFVVTYEMNGKTETRELCEGGPWLH
jgi:hypothetical protein